MSDLNAKSNWQARTLAGSFLRKQVADAVLGFNAAVECWQREGGEGGLMHCEDYSPITELIADLEELRKLEDLCFWSDTPEAHEAIDSFRRELQEVPSHE